LRETDIRFYDIVGQRIQLADLRVEDTQNPTGPLGQYNQPEGLNLFVEIADLGQITRANNEATRQERRYADLIFRFKVGSSSSDVKVRIHRGGYWRTIRNGNTGTNAFYDGKGRYQDHLGVWQFDQGQVVHGPFAIQSGTGTTDETVVGRGPTPRGWYGLYERIDFRANWLRIGTRWNRPQIDHNANENRQPLGFLQQGSYCQWATDGDRAGTGQNGQFQHAGANPPASVRYKFELVNWGHTAHGRTELQVHPDGFRDGTAGCVGTQSYADCCRSFFLLRNYYGTKLLVEAP
jgi:hypothetical protein